MLSYCFFKFNLLTLLSNSNNLSTINSESKSRSTNYFSKLTEEINTYKISFIAIRVHYISSCWFPSETNVWSFLLKISNFLISTCQSSQLVKVVVAYWAEKSTIVRINPTKFAFNIGGSCSSVSSSLIRLIKLLLENFFNMFSTSSCFSFPCSVESSNLFNFAKINAVAAHRLI